MTPIETLTTWAAGEPCDKHDLAFCATCRDQANIRRDRDGELRFDGDCAVRAFAAITGADYAEAAELMAVAGFRPGRGTPPMEGARTAFEAAGYGFRSTSMDLGEAKAASATGRAFYVSSYKRRGRPGHAWAIVDGRHIGAWSPPFNYRIFEVTA